VVVAAGKPPLALRRQTAVVAVVADTPTDYSGRRISPPQSRSPLELAALEDLAGQRGAQALMVVTPRLARY
jgi:hypothetical protein